MPDATNEPVRLWNPNAAANWSVLLTPVFGAFIQMRNWKVLGKRTEAFHSMLWMVVSLCILMTYFALKFSPSIQSAPAEEGRQLTNILIVLLLTWYFASARKQVKFVQTHFGKSYAKRSWLIPVIAGCIGLGSLSAFFETISKASA